VNAFQVDCLEIRKNREVTSKTLMNAVGGAGRTKRRRPIASAFLWSGTLQEGGTEHARHERVGSFLYLVNDFNSQSEKFERILPYLSIFPWVEIPNAAVGLLAKARHRTDRLVSPNCRDPAKGEARETLRALERSID
jgi:hypothetical protein